MMRLVLGFLLALAAAAPAQAFNHRPSLRVTQRALSSRNPVEVARATDRAMDALVQAAARALEERGYDADAARITSQWHGQFAGLLPALVERRALGLEDIGDHAPLSQWLVDVYIQLESRLGAQLMQLLHFDDLWTLNFAIPVVFHLDVIGDDQVDLADYGLHWVPFSGVVAYWGTWAACEVATWGSGWFVVCTPAGMVAEYATVRWIAPPLTDDAYRFLYRP